MPDYGADMFASSMKLIMERDKARADLREAVRLLRNLSSAADNVLVTDSSEGKWRTLWRQISEARAFLAKQGD